LKSAFFLDFCGTVTFRMVLFSIVLVLGMAGTASAVTLTDVTLFTATGTTQAEEVIGDRVISHRFLRAS